MTNFHFLLVLPMEGAVTTEDEERATALENEVRAMKVETEYLKGASSKQRRKPSSESRDIHSGGASNKHRDNTKAQINEKISPRNRNKNRSHDSPPKAIASKKSSRVASNGL